MIEHKECRYGHMLYLKNDEWVGRSFRLYGEAFQNQINFMLRFIGPEALPNTVDDLLVILDHHQYVGYFVVTDYYNPGNYFGNKENVFGEQKSGDIICWHRNRDEEMEPRFQDAMRECNGVVSFFRTDV